MKQAVVLKLIESVDDSNLRFLNELRLSFIPKGTKADYTSINRMSTTATPLVKFEILSGSGYFTNGTGTINYGSSAEVAMNMDLGLRVYATTPIEVSVKNFDIACVKLGEVNAAPFVTRNSDINSPDLVLSSKDLMYKSFLVNINADFHGDVSDFKRLNNLEGIGILGENTKGDLLSLSSLTKLKAITVASKNVKVSFSSLVAVKNENLGMATGRIIARESDLVLGDVYQYFLHSSAIYNEDLSRTTSLTPLLTCSYVSGDTLPVLQLGFLQLFASGIFELPDALAFLTMLKDGITTPSKITLVGSNKKVTMSAESGVLTNATFMSLKSDLAGLGLTIEAAL